MLIYTSSQGVNDFKALICIEDRFRDEISRLRTRLFREEKMLSATIVNLVALEESIKRFYSTYYLPKLGRYISVLKSLKEKFWGVHKSNNMDETEKKVEDDGECDLKTLKEVYRQVAKIYHPDRYDSLSEEEKEFFEFRMDQANRYFEKGDIRSLKGMLEQAKVEISDEIPSYERIRLLKIRIDVIGDLKDLYNRRIEDLKNDEVYKIMGMSEDEREKEIERRKEILISEINLYSKLLRDLGRLFQK